ncbi:hypothetical protein CXB51_035071 [Gossypium anomalum]|uniref:Uncharacterized protein n=1 Tax=Gossypium anomalum TaxID=47600 RepID=A0A8J6CHX8_9ROSI|nr:hypothetical protein CXB51_035071 [Gossypium anomalum]
MFDFRSTFIQSIMSTVPLVCNIRYNLVILMNTIYIISKHVTISKHQSITLAINYTIKYHNYEYRQSQ